LAKLIQELPSATAVAPGQTATIRVPETATYSAIWLYILHGASTAMTQTNQRTLIENVKLKIASSSGGAQTIWDLTGAELVDLNAFYKVPVTAGWLPLLFGRPWLRDVPGLPDGRAEDKFALGTADLSNVTLEVRFAAGVTSPVLTSFGEIYAGDNRRMGQIVKLDSKRGYNAAAAGDFEISDIPIVGPRVGLQALHFKTDQINRAEIVANGTIIQDATPGLMQLVQDKRSIYSGGRDWQPGFTHFEFAGNRYSDILETTGFRDFRVKLDMAAAETFDVITETVIGDPNA